MLIYWDLCVCVCVCACVCEREGFIYVFTPVSPKCYFSSKFNNESIKEKENTGEIKVCEV